MNLADTYIPVNVPCPECEARAANGPCTEPQPPGEDGSQVFIVHTPPLCMNCGGTGRISKYVPLQDLLDAIAEKMT